MRGRVTRRVAGRSLSVALTRCLTLWVRLLFVIGVTLPTIAQATGVHEVGDSTLARDMRLQTRPSIYKASSGPLESGGTVDLEVSATTIGNNQYLINWIWMEFGAPGLRCGAMGQPEISIETGGLEIFSQEAPYSPDPLWFGPSLGYSSAGTYVYFYDKPDRIVTGGDSHIVAGFILLNYNFLGSEAELKYYEGTNGSPGVVAPGRSANLCEEESSTGKIELMLPEYRTVPEPPYTQGEITVEVVTPTEMPPANASCPVGGSPLVTQSLAIDPSTPSIRNPAKFTVVVSNVGCSAFTPEILAIGGRGPGGDDDIQDVLLLTDMVLNPGESRALSVARAFEQPGLHTAFMAYRHDGNIWTEIHAAEGVTPRISFDVSPSAATMQPKTGDDPSPNEGQLPLVLGSLDLDRWCRESYQSPEAGAVHREPFEAYTWFCHVNGEDQNIDMQAVAGSQYGAGAEAVWVDTEWLAFQAQPEPSIPGEPAVGSVEQGNSGGSEHLDEWHLLNDGCSYHWNGTSYDDVQCPESTTVGWTADCYGPFADGQNYYWDGSDFSSVGCQAAAEESPSESEPPQDGGTTTGSVTGPTVDWHPFDDGCQYYWDGSTWSDADCPHASDWPPDNYGPFANGCAYHWDGQDFTYLYCE